MTDYKICSRCIMDTTSDPNLELDENGVCNYCRDFDEEKAKMRSKYAGGRDSLGKLFEQIKKEEKNKEYDCLLGISGGVDSSYMAYLAKQYDLRVLAVHVDAGWNSELAVKNIEKICSKLGYDLHTLVVDWNAMKELQRAFLFSGLANQDVPQDHSFIAGCDELARKFKIRYILNGNNLATEGILSKAYQYHARDWKNISAVHKAHGRGKSLKGYPHENFLHMYVLNQIFHSATTIYPLEYIDYSKKDAIALLEKEFGWQYYGGKHYESRFTKFFQEVYLPERYGWRKQRDHISSLIVGGEMTREEGLAELERMRPSEQELRQETEYILKKLEISEDEWKEILKLPHKTGADYPNYESLARFCTSLKSFILGGNSAK